MRRVYASCKQSTSKCGTGGERRNLDFVHDLRRIACSVNFRSSLGGMLAFLFFKSRKLVVASEGKADEDSFLPGCFRLRAGSSRKLLGC